MEKTLGHVENEVCVLIAADQDVVAARQHGRAIALQLGFSASDSTLLATAISELARNIVTYAGHGEICVRATQNSGCPSITVTARDKGPGIVSIEQAMRDGYSTSGSLGLGLPGVRRLVDEFEITSVVGQGTTVTVRKWKS